MEFIVIGPDQVENNSDDRVTKMKGAYWTLTRQRQYSVEIDCRAVPAVPERELTQALGVEIPVMYASNLSRWRWPLIRHAIEQRALLRSPHCARDHTEAGFGNYIYLQVP